MTVMIITFQIFLSNFANNLTQTQISSEAHIDLKIDRLTNTLKFLVFFKCAPLCQRSITQRFKNNIFVGKFASLPLHQLNGAIMVKPRGAYLTKLCANKGTINEEWGLPKTEGLIGEEGLD